MLLTKMGYKGGGIGINGQGIIQPMELVEIPLFASLGYGKEEVGECSKEVEARGASKEEPKHVALSKEPKPEGDTTIHDESKCKWISIMLQSFSQERSSKKERKTSVERIEHSKGVKTYPPH